MRLLPSGPFDLDHVPVIQRELATAEEGLDAGVDVMLDLRDLDHWMDRGPFFSLAFSTGSVGDRWSCWIVSLQPPLPEPWPPQRYLDGS